MNNSPTLNEQLERGLAWLRAMARHGARKFDKQGATVLLAGIEQLQKENAVLAQVVAARMDEELEPADPAECCIFGNGSGNRCVTHQRTWATGRCPATLPRALQPLACEYEQDGYRIETACGNVFHLNACEDPPDHCGRCGKVLTIKQSVPPPSAALDEATLMRAAALAVDACEDVDILLALFANDDVYRFHPQGLEFARAFAKELGASQPFYVQHVEALIQHLTENGGSLVGAEGIMDCLIADFGRASMKPGEQA